MKSEFIIVKDPHYNFGFDAPSKRKEANFDNEIRDKNNFIKDYAKKNNIKEIIYTGDFFNVSSMHKWNFVKLLKNKIEIYNLKEQFKKIHTIIGNHDFMNGNYQNIDNIPLNIFFENNLINHLSNNPIKTNNFSIFGIDFKKTWKELEIEIKNIISNKGSENIGIVIHHNVSPKKKEFFVSTSYKDLNEKFPEIKLWIFGHYHKGFRTEIINNSVFINPWSLTRLSEDKYVVSNEHKPEFVHLTIEDNGGISFKNIKIPVKHWKESFYNSYKPTNISEDLKKVKNLNTKEEMSDSEILDLLKEKDFKNYKLSQKEIEIVFNDIKGIL